MSRTPLVLAVVTAGACVVSVIGLVRTSDGRAPVAAPPVELVETTAGKAPAAPQPAAASAASVLRVWDEARAEAWAHGDLRLLSTLYTPGSVAGRRDGAMLRAWRARGLVVSGLRTQLLTVRELGRTRSTWTLQVTDRLVGGVAIGADVRRPLPGDAATTHTVELRRLHGHWRVASVLSPAGGDH